MLLSHSSSQILAWFLPQSADTVEGAIPSLVDLATAKSAEAMLQEYLAGSMAGGAGRQLKGSFEACKLWNRIWRIWRPIRHLQSCEAGVFMTLPLGITLPGGGNFVYSCSGASIRRPIINAGAVNQMPQQNSQERLVAGSKDLKNFLETEFRSVKRPTGPGPPYRTRSLYLSNNS